MVLAAVFAITVGFGMVGQWAVSAALGRIPEIQTEPARIAFHLAAEFTTALMLVIAGVGLLVQSTWARDLFLVASGMLIYTSIVSPGYFVQKGQKLWLAFFGLILVMDIWAISGLWG